MQAGSLPAASEPAPHPAGDAAYTLCRLLVLSGTGNTFRVASRLAELCAARGVAAAIHPLTAPLPAPFVDPRHLIGLLSPTHGFTAPWGVIRRACALPRGQGAHAFVIATRGATPVGRFMCPGLEGTTAYLLALILALRGYRLRGVTAIDMPVNWIAVHPGIRPETARRMSARSLPRAEAFLDALLAGRRRYRGWIGLALGLLLARVSLAYLLMGRFFLAKLFFPSAACTGCGQCARACPFGALRMKGRPAPRPYWTFTCESCMRCMAYCPTRAIEVSHPWAVGLTLLTAGVVFSARTSGRISGWLTPGVPAGALPVLVWLIQYGLCLATLWLAYRLLWQLARLPAVNRLLACTTLTRVFRRYHEPGTQLDDLTRVRA